MSLAGYDGRDDRAGSDSESKLTGGQTAVCIAVGVGAFIITLSVRAVVDWFFDETQGRDAD